MNGLIKEVSRAQCYLGRVLEAHVDPNVACRLSGWQVEACVVRWARVSISAWLKRAMLGRRGSKINHDAY